MSKICQRQSWPLLADTCHIIGATVLIIALQAEDGMRAERGEIDSPALQALWAWVGSSLLASSHDRKYLAFQLFTLLLPSLR